MILYNVTVNIDTDIHDEWLDWMKSTHIPDVLNTGLFVEHKLLRLLNEEPTGEITYAVQYFLNSLQELKKYQSDFAPELQQAHTERFKDKFVAFRTVLEVV